MRMSEKCHNNNNNNSDKPLTSRRTDGGQNAAQCRHRRCQKKVVLRTSFLSRTRSSFFFFLHWLFFFRLQTRVCFLSNWANVFVSKLPVPLSLKCTVFSSLNNLYRRALQVYFQNTHLTIFASFLDMSVLFLSILCAHFYLQLFPSFLSALSYVKSIGEFWPGLLWKIGPVLFVSGTGVY